MRKLLSCFALLWVLFLGLPPAFAAENLEISAAAEVSPGDPFGVIIRGENEINDADLNLLDETGRIVLSVKGFRLDDRSWAATAGIPSTLTPGAYTVRVESRTGQAIALVSRPLLVKQRSFVLEDIPLSQAMSDLRSEQDPRKDEEARELYRLLLSFNPHAVYQRDAFRLPVGPSRESSFFGDRRTYIYSDGGRAKSIHQGIDFAVPRGTPVLAAGTGRVVLTGQRILTGNTVVLEHLPGVYSLYFHLDGIEVQTGDLIESGARIGVSGATGLVTGPHLHWELRAAGVAVDPKKLLIRGFFDQPSVLLPDRMLPGGANP